jgi:hypothetical protein
VDTRPPYTYLLHGTTHHGLNYQEPAGLRRLATTYYHRMGPVGVIMERFNWFNFEYDPKTGTRTYHPQPQNTYHADARQPVSIIGLGADPMSQLVNAWSEPPYATIGLGTGTMASYARCFQHAVYYEIDDTIKSFHFPGPNGRPFFNYVPDALNKRQAGIEIIMGDARLSMRDEPDQNTGFYPHRDKYYHALVVDAFSSDAIPVHLITKEAIQMYFDKLVPEGVLMVHTSNRHLELVLPVTDVAKSLGLAWRVGKDGGQRVNAEGKEIDVRGLFASEYVMIARDEKYLPPETTDPTRGGLTWYTPPAPNSRVWTDDFSNLLSVFRWVFGRGGLRFSRRSQSGGSANRR